MNLSKFFAELKRRNVYKVGIAYGVVAWLLIQIATQVFPFFEIPNWAVRLIVLVVIVGFPIALVIAWAFELTPEGLKRTETADAEHLPGRSQKRAWIYVVIIAGAISVGIFFLGRYTTSKSSVGTELSGKSIAVLPFDNLSRDPDNAYFAEGIQDEILARLAKIADLKVISRTSTQKYKSAPDNLREIAKQLDVVNILEGSVQKAADQVRVTVQLINATNDAHLWAETYDRKLTDIFTVESEIAKTIADTLRAKLTGSEERMMSKKPTANPEAYEFYLKGRFFWNKRTGVDLRKAIDYFNQAVAKDPSYALAYAGLADAYVLLSGFGAASPKDSLPQAKAAAEKALELDSTLGEAHASLAQALLAYDFDFAGANRVAPLSQFEDAIAQLKRALQLDPLSMIINADVGTVLTNARRYDEAIEQLRKTLEMDPSFYYAHYNLGEALEMKGLTENAIAEYQRAIALNDDPVPQALLGHLYAKIGKKNEARQILQQLHESSKQHYVSPYLFAMIHIGLGDKNQAIDFLEKTYEDRDGYSIAFIKVDPFLDPLRSDPRFEALVQKVFTAKE